MDAMRKPLFLVTLLTLLALTAAAADVTGKWTAQVPGRDGQTREVTFTFKQSGDTLTGTMTGRQGDVPISDGKVAGDTISFSAPGGGGGNVFKYTGTISGSEIKMKREGGQGQPREFVAKRAAS
jgi:opacity protein-like surface antigen